MKQHWIKLATKVNALSQRERIILCATVAVITFVAVYMPVITPLAAKQKNLRQQLSEQQARLGTIEEQIKMLETPGPNDPNLARRQHIGALKQESLSIDEELLALQKTLVPPDNMSALLEDLLKRNGNLKLVKLNTLAASPLIKPSSDAPKPAEAAPAGSPVPASKPLAPPEARLQIFKHGVEITVEGSYRDLLRYLAELEKLPWRMYWSQVQLQVDEQPPRTQMTFTVFTLSLEQTWLSL